MTVIKNSYIFFIVCIIAGLILFIMHLPGQIKKKKDVADRIYLNQQYVYLLRLLQENKYQKAYSYAASLYKKYSGKADTVCVLLGELNMQTGNHKDAEWFYRKALAIDPRNVGNYGALAGFYRSLGQEESVYLVLNKGLERAPCNVKLLRELAVYYLGIDDYEQALALFKKITMNTRNRMVYGDIGKILYQYKIPKADYYFFKFLRKGGSLNEVNKLKRMINPRGNHAKWYYGSEYE